VHSRKYGRSPLGELKPVTSGCGQKRRGVLLRCSDFCSVQGRSVATRYFPLYQSRHPGLKCYGQTFAPFHQAYDPRVNKWQPSAFSTGPVASTPSTLHHYHRPQDSPGCAFALPIESTIESTMEWHRSRPGGVRGLAHPVPAPLPPRARAQSLIGSLRDDPEAVLEIFGTGRRFRRPSETRVLPTLKVDSATRDRDSGTTDQPPHDSRRPAVGTGATGPRAL
jgi:hypothetical protein